MIRNGYFTHLQPQLITQISWHSLLAIDLSWSGVVPSMRPLVALPLALAASFLSAVAQALDPGPVDIPPKAAMQEPPARPEKLEPCPAGLAADWLVHEPASLRGDNTFGAAETVSLGFLFFPLGCGVPVA